MERPFLFFFLCYENAVEPILVTALTFDRFVVKKRKE